MRSRRSGGIIPGAKLAARGAAVGVNYYKSEAAAHDVVRVVAAFASDLLGFANGQYIAVDGGLTMP